MTYNGLDSCILNSHSYEIESGTNRRDSITTDSIHEDASRCSSSNNNALGSFSSHWKIMKWFEQELDQWEVGEIPAQGFYWKEKPVRSVGDTDVETMKERFAKLLLGEDITGGRKGLSTSLVLSNAITNLAASVFGELWKLEPLPEERKSKWRIEMDWLLSPTKYMVELVPAKLNGADGRTIEIMTPKARADICVNIPALQKLDAMLIETLDLMVSAEFWYVEGGSWAEGRSRRTRLMRRWRFPLPQVPITGLSEREREKLLNLGEVVHEIFKAAKSINETILLRMPVPTVIKDALPQCGRASLGEELYRILSVESKSAEEMLNALNLKSKQSAIETINRLEAAVFAWKERVTEQDGGKCQVRKSWSCRTDLIFELEKKEVLMDRAEALIQVLKTRYPNLPQTFLDVVKIQYGKDVGHSILEAYSRVLGDLAFKILSRIGDILQEDVLSNPNLQGPIYCFPGMGVTKNVNSPMLGQRVRQVPHRRG